MDPDRTLLFLCLPNFQLLKLLFGILEFYYSIFVDCPWKKV